VVAEDDEGGGLGVVWSDGQGESHGDTSWSSDTTAGASVGMVLRPSMKASTSRP